MIEQAVRDILLANATVIQYTVTVYPLRVPQDGTYPNVVITRVSGVHITSLTAPSGLCQARIQLDFRARDYEDAKFIADAIRQAFNGFAGDVDGFVIQGAHLVGDQETDETPYAADDLPVFRVQHDYHVWYEE